MGANNECSANMDGKRAAYDLANATRPEDFTSKCWSIDQKLSSTNPEYANTFMAAMNTELQDKHLLPRVELNMAAAGDTPAMLALQNKKHVETQDLVRDENQLGRSGRITEAMLMHNLSSNAQEIHDTHAERNFWGKNHGGIDMDRLNRWADKNEADMHGAFVDTHVAPAAEPNNLKANDDHTATDRTATKYDRKQDAEISHLKEEVAQEKKAREESEKATQLKEKVEAGVIKDAHHTVKHGETLYDMACLALHKAGRDHLTPKAIKFEEDKIRALNNLAPHETLRSGQSLMLRTEQEVAHETARRIKLNHDGESPVPRPEWHAPRHGYINQSRGYSNESRGYSNENSGYRDENSGYINENSGYIYESRGY